MLVKKNTESILWFKKLIL